MDVRSKREILAESPLFSNLLPAELSMLAELFTVRDYRAGEIVFHEGDEGDAVFVIASGQVDVRRKNARGESVSMAILSAPHFFGEMSLIDKERRSATVGVTVDSRLLRLANDNLHVFAKNYRNGFTWVVVNIARTLSSRLRAANQKLVEVP